MKQRVKYYKDFEMKEPFYVDYDDEDPCRICNEPVIAASMGGTDICPSCDLGRCRYCNVPRVVFKESFDNGRSKKEFLKHIKYHKEKEPNFNKKSLEVHRKFREKHL